MRDRLGIRPGSTLLFQAEGGNLVATKLLPVDPVAAVYGIIKLRHSTDDLMTKLRGQADA